MKTVTCCSTLEGVVGVNTTSRHRHTTTQRIRKLTRATVDVVINQPTTVMTGHRVLRRKAARTTTMMTMTDTWPVVATVWIERQMPKTALSHHHRSLQSF